MADYRESDYFFNHFPFATKTPLLGNQNYYLDKPKLEEINDLGNKTKALQLPINWQIDYYLKIPKGSSLKLLFKDYGLLNKEKHTEFSISIQEENMPVKSLYSYKFSEYSLKNQWEKEKINLNVYRNKTVRISFRMCSNGEASEHLGGLLFQPLLTVSKSIFQSQRKTARPIKLKISNERLKTTNIIIIVLDAARSDHFSCYGYNRPTSPYIDQFAQDGVLFKNAFSVAPYTVSSTTSLFTSLYPYTHQVTVWQKKIPKKLITLAEVLKDNGYVTYGSGFIMEWAGKGFQEIFDLHIDTQGGTPEDSLDTFLQSKFSNRNTAQPAFIYIHIRPPHADYCPPKKFDKWTDPVMNDKYAHLAKGVNLREIDKSKKSIKKEELQYLINRYDGNLFWADWLANIVLSGLKKFGLYDNSLVILTSDHGEAFLEHGKILHNTTVYNEMIKIPLIMKFPQYIKPRHTLVNANVENIDIMPTILNFLQTEPSNTIMQGKSILPLIFCNVKQIKPYLLSRAINGEVFSFYDFQFKYVQTYEQGELFHLESDPNEIVNLSPKYPILFGYYKASANFYKNKLITSQSILPEDKELDDETKKRLRSLGYIK